MLKENMPPLPGLGPLIADIQYNCDISDARDHGIYSMCTMVLKLRNLFKWERGLQPWEEPEPADLLDWIEGKENYWATLTGESFCSLTDGAQPLAPFDVEEINAALPGQTLLYGAGYGRSMKAIFFLAEKIEERRDAGCAVVVLGREWAREMASPFAMVQDGVIFIRREALRFFLWDQIQEVHSSCRTSLIHALQSYGVFSNGALDQDLLRSRLDIIVDREMELFIRHEVGETLQDGFSSATLQALIGHFPGTVIEFVGRAVKDIIADSHPQGLLAYLVTEQRESSLAFYLAFLDALRAKLFPEILAAWQQFVVDHQWRHVEEARRSCWQRNLAIGRQLSAIAAMIGKDSDETIMRRFTSEILEPLGLDGPQQNP